MDNEAALHTKLYASYKGTCDFVFFGCRECQMVPTDESNFFLQAARVRCRCCLLAFGVCHTNDKTKAAILEVESMLCLKIFGDSCGEVLEMERCVREVGSYSMFRAGAGVRERPHSSSTARPL